MPTNVRRIGGRTLTLDARPDRLDLRDRMYLPHLTNLHEPREWPSDQVLETWLPAYRAAGLVLDQGEEGACTGFGLAAVINFQLFVHRTGRRSTRMVSAAMLYELARLYDEWPGEDYEGSSCRGALKGWHRHGVCREALWPGNGGTLGRPVEDARRRNVPARNWDLDALETTLGTYYRVDVRSVVDMQSAIRETGAIYVSADVHEGWDVASRRAVKRHADLVRIEYVTKPKQPGGHAFALVGYNDLGFVAQNSWGARWGSSGFALLPYEDWVAYGSDAWVFSLGVSRQRAVTEQQAIGVVRSPRHYVPAADVGEQSQARTVGIVSGGDAITRKFRGQPAERRPLSTDDAYRHAIVLDRGFPVKNDITAGDAVQGVHAAGLTRPLEWMRAAPGKGRRRIVVYAHGGLNSEASAIVRARVLAPYLLAHDIYPIFVVWRSGAMETISDIVEEMAARLGLGGDRGPAGKGWREHLTDATDRMLESLLRPAGAALWGQMKTNAVRASESERGGMRILIDALGALKAAAPNTEIHLVGHSAGSIVLGAMLTRMGQVGLRADSLRLYAAACTMAFVRERYLPAVAQGVLRARDWTNHHLSDQNERADAVGPYRKSLLYLVSRAFEDDHKTPLLGMQLAHDVKGGAIPPDGLWSSSARKDLVAWRSFRTGDGSAITAKELKERSITNGVTDIKPTHGCFDNAVPVVAETIDALRGKVQPSSAVGMRLDY